MTAHRMTLLIGGFLVLCGLVYSQSKTTPLPAPAALGYQLIQAEVTIPSSPTTYTDHRLYLFDSASGRVWEYFPEGTDKNGKFHEPVFVGVSVTINNSSPESR